MMKAININGEIKTYSTIPNQWNEVFNYHNAVDRHFADGWMDVIIPPYNSNTEKLGELIQDGDNITYEVITLSDNEVKNRISSNAEMQKESLIQSRMKKQVETELQGITDDSEILENQSGYPLWSSFPDQYPFPADFKVQDFEGLELKLFRIIQPHSKQDDRIPVNAPALWTKIEFSGGIEVWAAPIGGYGKYPYINPDTGEQYLVSHNGQTWKNIVPAPTLNVWTPGEYGWEVVY